MSDRVSLEMGAVTRVMVFRSLLGSETVGRCNSRTRNWQVGKLGSWGDGKLESWKAGKPESWKAGELESLLGGMSGAENDGRCYLGNQTMPDVRSDGRAGNWMGQNDGTGVRAWG